MKKFPVDAPKRKIKSNKDVAKSRFSNCAKREYISMVRENPDGSKTPLTMSN